MVSSVEVALAESVSLQCRLSLGPAEVALYRVELVCFVESLALSAALAALVERADHLRPQRRQKNMTMCTRIVLVLNMYILHCRSIFTVHMYIPVVGRAGSAAVCFFLEGFFLL